MKKLIIGILGFLLIVGVVGLFIFPQIKPFGVSTNKSSDTALLQERIVELSELATLKYEYSKAIVSRTEKNIPMTDINFAESIKLIEYTGYLKAGTDLSKIELSNDQVSEELSVKVPKSKILDNVAETEKMKITDVKGNIFSDSPTQTIVDEINADKEQLVEEKINQGFLEEADKRTEEVLTSFLKSNGFNNVIIEFY